jgi:protoporphyrinogen oxidase
MVEHTHLADPEQYGGNHIIYLSRYLADRSDPLWQADDDMLLETVCTQLQRLFPEFIPADILGLDVFRASDSQPVFRTGYGTRIPPFATPWPGLFLLNSSQLYPHSRCLNTSLILTDHFLQSGFQPE